MDLIPEVFSWTWNPPIGLWGLLPFCMGSICVALLAVLIATPLAIGLSVFLNFAPDSLRFFLKTILYGMSSIPTVILAVIGFFACQPLLLEIGAHSAPYSLALTGFILAILISPWMTLSIAKRIEEKKTSYAEDTMILGLTPIDAMSKIILPATIWKIGDIIALGFARAASDTMIPLVLSGNSTFGPQGFFAPFRTLTAHLVLLGSGDLSGKQMFVLFWTAGLLVFLVLVISKSLIFILKGNRS